MPDGLAQTSSPLPSSAKNDPLIGRTINGRFRICALVARGGMGMVYRAEQAPLGRACALKILNSQQAVERDPDFEKRFNLETSIASKLTHPNTVTVFDYGVTDDGLYYMAMEYLEGNTLHRAIRDEGAFSEERASYISRQICRSLREAHSLGVIHRDLKPTNIFLAQHADERDFVKVLDFGMVKNLASKDHALTRAGLFMGSPKYMAPEQIKGDDVDCRTDIYSLGIIMYEMLTGKVPFDRPNSVHIMMAHVNDTPPPMRSINQDIHVTPSFEAIVLKCLEKDPDRRFASMDALLSVLKDAGRSASFAFLQTGEFGSFIKSGGALSLLSSRVSNSNSNSGQVVVSSTARDFAPASSLTITDSAQVPIAPKLSARPIVALVIAGALSVGVGAVAYLAAPTKATSAPAQSISPPSESAPALPSTAVIHLDSSPRGAKVRTKDGRVLCDTTPCNIQFDGDEAEEGTTHELVFELAGHRTANETVTVSHNSAADRLVFLQREESGGPSKPPTPRSSR